MSQFLTTIEAGIADIAPQHSTDPAALTAQVMAVVTPQITGLQDSMNLAATDLASVKGDLADTQKAVTDIVAALLKNDPQSALVIAQQAVPAAAPTAPADAPAADTQAASTSANDTPPT